MNFLDDNHIEGEMSDQDFFNYISKLKERRENGDNAIAKSGQKKVYSEKKKYKNIPYDIIIWRFYNLRDLFQKEWDLSEIGKYATIETPENLERFEEIVEQMNGVIENDSILYTKFLYEDTIHEHQRKWTLKQMVEWLDNEIKKQIDSLDNMFLRFLLTIEKKIKKFNELYKEFIKISENLKFKI